MAKLFIVIFLMLAAPFADSGSTLRFVDGKTLLIDSDDPEVVARVVQEAKLKAQQEKNQREAERRARQKVEQSAIYQNCLIDLMPSQPTYEVRNAVKSRCTKINNDPSFWEKMKYGD